MADESPLSLSELDRPGALDKKLLYDTLCDSLKTLNKKIIVLDDDPTGVQTVHGISVYTGWSPGSIRTGFEEENNLFFILTNSRSLTSGESRSLHEEIARNILKAAGETGRDFIIVSRSDSTLRGHYPLETQVLKDTVEGNSGLKFDGEILCPFFKEGGRYTIGNVHYVADGDRLIPAGQSEFARDKTFGFVSSHLGEWCEEKSAGTYRKDGVTYVPLESLRAMDVDGIEKSLLNIRGFNKVVVNAVDYDELMVFALAFLTAVSKGKRFILRSAASLVKVLGGIPDKPLLTAGELIKKDEKNGGLIIVGSHVNKTTRQLDMLKTLPNVEFIEFNQHLVLDPEAIKKEIERASSLCTSLITSGRTAALYTRRDRLDLDTADREEQLNISVRISDAVTAVAASLGVQPAYIIAKGGITSSDIGVKALKVQKAVVAGQISPGVPVWITGGESRYPGMAYVIFPGNVGKDETLRDIAAALTSRK